MALIFEPLAKLDTTNGHCIEVKLSNEEPGLIAQVQYRRGPELFSRTLQFRFASAYSFYDETMMPLTFRHCSDMLCEVFGSDWSDLYKSRRAMMFATERHHYAIYFSECGYLEVFSRDVIISVEVPT